MKNKINFIATMLTGFLYLYAATFAYATGPQYFYSPAEAEQALIAALKSSNSNAEILKIMGTKAEGLLGSGDIIEQKAAFEYFLSAYQEDHQLKTAKTNEQIYILSVGKNSFDLPIPITQKKPNKKDNKNAQKWYFDIDSGYDELLTKRIGRNELDVLQACLAFVDAEREYYNMNPDGGSYGFAARIISSKGKKDGLYWPTINSEQASPLGELFTKASASYQQRKEAANKAQTKKIPYHGYFYQMLPAQGQNAPGGAYKYAGADNTITGFALLAYPAEYGLTGIMSFIVNQDGIVYEKDLGSKINAANIKTFNPDQSWSKVDPKNLAQTE